MLRKVLFVALFVLFGTVLGLVIADAQGPRPGTRAPSALAGTAFTYQGQLKNGGVPVNGTCDFGFRLYDAPSSGTQIGSVISTTVPVTYGLFTVPLDFGASAFNGDARWLDVLVRCGGGAYTELTTRQALTPAPMAFALPGLYTQQNATSPNVIGGYSGNVISATVVGGTIGGGGKIGFENKVWANYATVSGGYDNTASNPYATIGGGNSNHASNYYATVGGGYGNTASNSYATIGGGIGNTALGNEATVGGGYFNTASSYDATVGGGYENSASAPEATIGGGSHNTAGKYGATVSGGRWNTASGYHSTIPGGIDNSATMSYTLAAGSRAKAVHQGAFVWGDSTGADVSSSKEDQFVIRASGGVSLPVNAGSSTAIDIGERYRDNAIIAWAKVPGSNGDPGTNKLGVSSIAHSPLTGIYTITLTANASNAATLIPIAIAEIDNPPASASAVRIVSINQTAANQFAVYINNGNWALTDNDFVFIVTGR